MSHVKLNLDLEPTGRGPGSSRPARRSLETPVAGGLVASGLDPTLHTVENPR